MSIVFPRVLWSNAGRDGTVVYTNEDPDYPADNALDWLSYSLWLITDSILDVTLDNAYDIDSFAWYGAEGSATSVQLQWDSDGAGTFVTLATLNNPANVPILVTFTSVSVPAGRRIRLVITGASAYYVRQWAAGPIMTAERGQSGGLNPPTLEQEPIVNNSMAENGALIGRDYRRQTRRTSLALEHLTQSWVRNTWEPFATHALRYAFFYAWDLDNYPDEVTMAAARTINGPTNMSSPPQYMQVTMPLEHVV